MRNWRTPFAIASALLVVCAVLALLAEPLWAQVRAALVKDVDHPARQPFAATSGIVAFQSSAIGASGVFLTVPAGKRAVIEHLSCIDFLDVNNSWIRFEIRFTTAGVTGSHQFVHTRVGPSMVPGIELWSLTEPVRAYADPGTAISINTFRRLGRALGVSRATSADTTWT